MREIHPFAVCILCESCPCPADGVCYACGMTFCQMCVRKMHTNGKTVPHYPCRNSTKFSEDLVKSGKEKEAERRMLKGPSNQWLMSDADFNHERDVYKERVKRGAPELCTYWAWSQTRYTVHLAVWLPSSDGNADIIFDQDPQGRQRIKLRPSNMPTLFERTFAHAVDESRAGDALFFQHMHCMTFCLAKANVGERWRCLFTGDSDGEREMPLADTMYTVEEEQTGGFKPINHYRIAGRKETASEWHEVTVSVVVPEESTRSLVSASISSTHLEVTVKPPPGGGASVADSLSNVHLEPEDAISKRAAAASYRPYLSWRRRLQPRTLKYEDGHTSRTHVDTANSTWLLGTDAAGRRCIQFVLAQWMEGANKNQEESISKQLKASGLSVLTEESDPFHLFDLLQAEMWLRAGAVYKPRSQLCDPAQKLVEEMEKHEEREGRDPAALRASPLAELWEGDEWQEGEGEEVDEEDEEPAYWAAGAGGAREGGKGARSQPSGGGEVDNASKWWESERAAELEAWREAVAQAAVAEEARHAQLEQARKESEARAAAAAEQRRENDEREAARRRKELLREHQRMVAAAREAEARETGELVAGSYVKKVEATIGVEAMRAAAAAAARANPPAPKPITPTEAVSSSSTGATGAPSMAAPVAATAATAVHSLAKCGYWFEDSGDTVKVTVPLADACGSGELPKDCASCDFNRLGARLEVRLPSGTHVLTLPELFKEIVPDQSELKLRFKTKRAALIMKKREPGNAWPKLAAV